MKILHWDEMFHPSFGYQINLLAKYQALQGHDVVIMTSDKISEHPIFRDFVNDGDDVLAADRKYEDDNSVKVMRLPIYGVVSGRAIYKPGFIKKIKEQQADIIMCHTNDTLSSIIIAASHKIIKTPLVFDNHMLDMASHNKLNKLFYLFFKTFITPIYKSNQWIVFRTQDDPYVNKRLGISLKQAPFLSFGSDVRLFHPDDAARKKFREEHSISQNAFVVVYAGKLTEAKGGLFLAEALKKRLVTNAELIFIIVGNAPPSLSEKIEQLFDTSENKIIRMHTQKYTELPLIYQAADLALYPKEVSLSFFDVQASGLPVVSSSNNINDERLSHGNGFTFPLNDINEFRDRIKQCIEMNPAAYSEMKTNSYRYVNDNYSYVSIAAQCTDVMQKEIDRQTSKTILYRSAFL